MDFNKLPLEAQLQIISNDLSNCHVLGSDALRYGSALQALQIVIEQNRKHDEE